MHNGKRAQTNTIQIYHIVFSLIYFYSFVVFLYFGGGSFICRSSLRSSKTPHSMLFFFFIFFVGRVNLEFNSWQPEIYCCCCPIFVENGILYHKSKITIYYHHWIGVVPNGLLRSLAGLNLRFSHAHLWHEHWTRREWAQKNICVSWTIIKCMKSALNTRP